MNRVGTIALALLSPGLVLFGVAGCSKPSPDSTAASAVPTSSASLSAGATSAPPASGAAASSIEAPPVALDGLVARLAREAANRPKVKPTADDVFAAFEGAGANLPRKQQSLGDTYKAAYCLGGYTADNALALSVCEYGDEAAASAGRDYSKQVFPRMATRDVWAHKADTLTIVQIKPDDATTALKKKLAAAFVAL
ncbi:MAG TPA: hypothetical protein VHV30_01075 [Polyangiaceae bacterium]|nr:hypothetical protein [Polyangiaceae bacterium]